MIDERGEQRMRGHAWTPGDAKSGRKERVTRKGARGAPYRDTAPPPKTAMQRGYPSKHHSSHSTSSLTLNCPKVHSSL